MEIELYKGEQVFTAELSVDPETGEILGGEALELLVKRNPAGTIAYILTAEAKKEMIGTRIKELQKASKTLENNAKRAKESLAWLMKQTGTKRIESQDKTFCATMSFECVEVVDVFDEKQLPADYFREIPAEYEPDKELIKKAIKVDKFEVPGAKIVKKDRLILR